MPNNVKVRCVCKKDQELVLKGKSIYLRRLKASDWSEFTTLAHRSERFRRGCCIEVAKNA